MRYDDTRTLPLPSARPGIPQSHIMRCYSRRKGCCTRPLSSVIVRTVQILSIRLWGCLTSTTMPASLTYCSSLLSGKRGAATSSPTRASHQPHNLFHGLVGLCLQERHSPVDFRALLTRREPTNPRFSSIKFVLCTFVLMWCNY